MTVREFNTGPDWANQRITWELKEDGRQVFALELGVGTTDSNFYVGITLPGGSWSKEFSLA